LFSDARKARDAVAKPAIAWPAWSSAPGSRYMDSVVAMVEGVKALGMRPAYAPACATRAGRALGRGGVLAYYNHRPSILPSAI